MLREVLEDLFFTPIHTGSRPAPARLAGRTGEVFAFGPSEATRKSTPDKTAVRSFHVLLTDLTTVALNDVSIGGSESFKLVTAPTPGQKKAFDLSDINPAKPFSAAGR